MPRANDPRSLDGVLATDKGVDYLCAFSVDDYTVEKMLFWLDVRQFQHVKGASLDRHCSELKNVPRSNHD